MGKILQNDRRYKMLLKLPKVCDGRVVFRKKPGKAKYIIAVLEIEGYVVSVFYRISTIYNEGLPVTAMSFQDFRRN